jgi:hypothetical protein
VRTQAVVEASHSPEQAMRARQRRRKYLQWQRYEQHRQRRHREQQRRERLQQQQLRQQQREHEDNEGDRRDGGREEEDGDEEDGEAAEQSASARAAARQPSLLLPSSPLQLSTPEAPMSADVAPCWLTRGTVLWVAWLLRACGSNGPRLQRRGADNGSGGAAGRRSSSSGGGAGAGAGFDRSGGVGVVPSAEIFFPWSWRRGARSSGAVAVTADVGALRAVLAAHPGAFLNLAQDFVNTWLWFGRPRLDAPTSMAGAYNCGRRRVDASVGGRLRGRGRQQSRHLLLSREAGGFLKHQRTFVELLRLRCACCCLLDGRSCSPCCSFAWLVNCSVDGRRSSSRTKRRSLRRSRPQPWG